MSDDFRRRRRLPNSNSPRRGGGNNNINPWIITIFAAVVVIIGGWFLGQALARVFNGPPKTQQVAQAPTPEPLATPPVSPSPQAAAEATGTPQATTTPAQTATPQPTDTPQPTPQPTPTATPQTTAAPATPSPAPTPTATPGQRHTQPIARRPEPTASSAPQAQTEGAASHVVRAYIDALRRGDPTTASSYLGNGVPDESFIDSATHITSISESPNGDGSYKVSVDMRTDKGEYYETFTVASGKILDKTAIKP